MSTVTATTQVRAGVGPVGGTLGAEAIVACFAEALGDALVSSSVVFEQAVVTVAPEAWHKAARFAKSDPRLQLTFFDWLGGVDRAEDGFGLTCRLYSVQHRHGVRLSMVVPGGRVEPLAPTLTEIFRGANWHEREAYDMYGITFDGHPDLLPRILTVENFEGFPLRKEFLLTTREVKPWPGAKEPEEQHAADEVDPRIALEASAEDKVRIEAEAKAKAEAEAAADAPEREEVEYDQELYDKLVAEGKSERVARSKAKAAAMRARKRAKREGETPEAAAETATQDMADPSIAKDAAAGAVGGDVAAGAPGDTPGVGEPVTNTAAEAATGQGADPLPGASPGPEAEGRHDTDADTSHRDDTTELPPAAPAPGSDHATLETDPQPTGETTTPSQTDDATEGDER